MFWGLLFIKVENTVMWTYCGVWNCSFCLYPRWSWSCIKFVHISYKKVSRNVRVSRLMAWEIGVRQLLLHMWQPFGNMQSGYSHWVLSATLTLSHNQNSHRTIFISKIADRYSETKKNFLSFLLCSNFFQLLFYPV